MFIGAFGEACMIQNEIRTVAQLFKFDCDDRFVADEIESLLKPLAKVWSLERASHHLLN